MLWCRLRRLLRFGLGGLSRFRLGGLLRFGRGGRSLLFGVRILLRKYRRGGEQQGTKDSGQCHNERNKALEHKAQCASHTRTDNLILAVLVQLRAPWPVRWLATAPPICCARLASTGQIRNMPGGTFEVHVAPFWASSLGIRSRRGCPTPQAPLRRESLTFR